jgi:replicative DNA helicase
LSSGFPNDQDAERQVLGSLIVKPDLIFNISSVLTAEDFYLEFHRVIFDALIEMSQSGHPVDSLQIINYLKDRSRIDAAGGARYILNIVQDVLAPGNASAHAKRVKSIAVRRKLATTIREIEEEALVPQEDESGFLRSVEDRVLEVTNESVSSGILSVQNVKGEFTDYVQRLLDAKGGLTGQPTRFEEFDQITSGLRGGELIVLAARPGVGKTTLAMNMAGNIVLHYKKPVLVYTLEMSRMELLLRMVCSEAQINHSDIKRGNITPEKVRPVLDSIENIFSSPLHIDDTGTLDIWDCITRTRKLNIDLKRRGESLGLIIVDYLQLMTDPQSRKQGRQQEVAAVSRSLKQLAKSVNAPILALSQMNRSVEQRKGDYARPQLSDLRESGAIEQDADIVMFIHREQPSEQESPEAVQNRGTAEIIIAKHRSGPTGSFRLAFRPEINRFDNMAREESYL